MLRLVRCVTLTKATKTQKRFTRSSISFPLPKDTSTIRDIPLPDPSFNPQVTVEEYQITGDDIHSDVLKASLKKYLEYDKRVHMTMPSFDKDPVKNNNQKQGIMVRGAITKARTYWEYGMYYKLIDLFLELIDEGAEPDKELYVLYMNSLLSLMKLKELEDVWYRYNLTSNPIDEEVIYPMLYCKLLRLDIDQIQKYYGMAEHLKLNIDPTLYQCRLQYHLTLNQNGEAEKWFDHMEKMSKNDAISFSLMIKYYSEIQSLQAKKHRYDRREKTDLFPEVEKRLQELYFGYSKEYRSSVLERMKLSEEKIAAWKDPIGIEREELQKYASEWGEISYLISEIESAILIESVFLQKSAESNQYDMMIFYLGRYNEFKAPPLASHIYEAIMNCQLVHSQDSEADKTWAVMRDLDIIPHPDLFTKYIGSLGVRGKMDKVIEISDEYHILGFPFKPEIARSTMFSYLEIKNYKQVKATYHKIIENGFIPDSICRNLMVLAMRMIDSDELVEGFLRDWIRSGFALSKNAIEVAAEFFISRGEIDDLVDLMSKHMEGTSKADPIYISLILSTLLSLGKLKDFDRFVDAYVGESKAILPDQMITDTINFREKLRKGEKLSIEELQTRLGQKLINFTTSVKFSPLD